MPGALGNIDPLLMGIDRLNNQQGYYNYDPNGYIDPNQMLSLQPQYLKQMFAMQNPRMALPQQLGGALGGFGAQLLDKLSGKAGPQQAAQPGVQRAPVEQDIENTRLQNLRAGMSQGEALYKAAQEAAASGRYEDDPAAQRTIDRATTWAVDKYKYEPQAEQKAALETSNLVNTTDGKRITVRRGPERWRQLIDSGDYAEAGAIPSLTPGSYHQFDKNGMIVTMQVQPDGSLKQVASSTQPVQYGATVTGDEAKAVWPNGPKTFSNADAAEVTKDLTNRSIATKNAIDSIDLLTKTASGASIGTPGEIAEKVSNARNTISTLAGMMGMSSDPNDYKISADTWKRMAPSLDRWAKAGIDAEKVKSLFLETALLDEATNGDKNASDANRKYSVEQHMKILGEDSSSPQALISTLQQRRKQLVNQLNNEFEGKPNVMSKPGWLNQENAKYQKENILTDAKEAIGRGANKAAVIQRLQSMGIQVQPGDLD